MSLKNKIFILFKKYAPRFVKETIRKFPPRLLDAAYKNIDVSDINKSEKYYFVCHTGESTRLGWHHIEIWLPIFLRYQKDYGINFVLLVRNQEFFDRVKKAFPSATVCYGRRSSDIEKIVTRLESVKLYLYLSSTNNNGHLVRFNSLWHVFLGHGDSEKGTSCYKVHRMYDAVWTAGEAHIDRFKNSGFDIRSLRFEKIGRPGLKGIVKQDSSMDESESIINVLYLPTWEGVLEENQYASLALSSQIVRDITTQLKIPATVKFHPSTGMHSTKYREHMEEVCRLAKQDQAISVMPLDRSLGDVLNGYGAFICDISSVVTECLVTQAPIFLYLPDSKDLVTATSNMPFEEYCYTFSDVQELLEKIKTVFDKNDYLRDQRRRALDYFIDVGATRSDKMAKLIMAMN